jgi:ABC-type antimicrobial peptide transport system ATPase subunit
LEYLDTEREGESYYHAVIVAQADPGLAKDLWILVLDHARAFEDEILCRFVFAEERRKAHNLNLCYVFSESELRQMAEGALEFLEEENET